MTCDRCNESREAGYLFCISCGEPLDSCPECAAAEERGSRFCPRCGRQLAQESRSFDTFGTLGLVATIIVAVMLVAELMALIIGAPSVWSWAADSSANVLFLAPRLTVIGSLEGLGLQLFWIFVLAAILLSAFHIYRQTAPALKAEPGERMEKIKDTPLFWMATLLCAALLLNVVIMLFQIDEVVGTDSVVEAGFVPSTLYSCANAAVWEEIITRVVYIGLPMAVIAAFLRRRDCLKLLLGGFGMSRLAMALIVISSLVFGFGHLDHWGLWKVLPTMISGLAMGYLYVRFGIHASIMFHFAVDYMAPLVDGPVAILTSVALMMIIVLGIPCLGKVLNGFRHLPEDVRGMTNLIPDAQDSRLFRRD